MRRDKKPVGRWFGEAILIFLSVFGAFYFENYREQKNENDLYIRYLKDFKSDLLDNQRKFEFELAVVYNPNNNEGYLRKITNDYDLLDSLLSSPSRKNGDTLAYLIDNGIITGVTEWIFASKQHERISKDYYSYIKNNTIKGALDTHYRDNLSRHNYKNNISEEAERYEREIEERINFNVYRTPENRAVIFSNQNINIIDRLGELYSTLKHFTQQNKTNDSLLILELDSELELWGAEH